MNELEIDTGFSFFGGSVHVSMWGSTKSIQIRVCFYPDSKRENEITICDYSMSLNDMIEIHFGRQLASWHGLHGAAYKAAQNYFAQEWAERELGLYIQKCHRECFA